MTPQDFKNRWIPLLDEDKLTPVSPDRLSHFKLQAATIDFLTMAGLPGSAAPFVSFVDGSDDRYNKIETLPVLYNFIDPEFAYYIVIGSDGGGNPIVINTNENDRIEWLDHEDDFAAHFFNTSIQALAGCLQAYQDFIKRIQAENGKGAFLDSNFTDEQLANLKQQIEREDPFALHKEGFWKDQLQMDLGMRDDRKGNQ